eukprot:TRINITY_DN5863_c0_g1_i9.p1 TRINITY_DN5863_c0_g1~~TRINITY_DN5863_c0_g1_i9.p1  ORF type:complete len:364 (-),score=114.13 TRINITY_DN5863_c0_g1_i9:210-1301(-)
MKQKKREEEEKALLASLFKQATNVKKDADGNAIKDKSQIICPYFKQGLCQKGKKCKFSHDLSIFKETEEINMYVDQRQQLFGSIPIQCQQTKIVCNNFLDAVEQGKYGWNWVCPNGMDCQYRHCIPQGYELKKDELQVQGEENPLEDMIEEQRSKIQSKGTKLTLEVFLKWKEDKKQQRKMKEEKKKEDEIKKIQAKQGGSAAVMSGRSLFIFNPNLFVDDEEALGDKDYQERNDNMSEKSDEQDQEEYEEKKDQQKDDEPWDENYIAQKIAELAVDEEPQKEEEIKEQTLKEEQSEEIKQTNEKQTEYENQNGKQVVEQSEEQEVKKKKKKNKKKKQKKQEDKAVVIDEGLFLDEKEKEEPK